MTDLQKRVVSYPRGDSKRNILIVLLEDTATHPEYDADFEASESCRVNYLELKTKVEAFLKSFRSLEVEVGFCLGSIAAKAVIP
ncbi:hypothetical protein AVEN_100305-1 [Araneus ventricosus]|uniref:Uncharacterized protein n=1 Tax=Araneus ventricosus TaxID=182803 RepID=A0A4Y2MNV7_ARAVE|nr:hypothetical protein AVEN_100305-1 [Araneus ventricosus]